MTDDYIMLIVSALLFPLIQCLWVKLIKDFKLKNITYGIISGIITIGYIFYSLFLFSPSPESISIFLVFMILTNLAITDYKYYEISGKSYYFLYPPIAVYIFSNTMYKWYECLISCAIIFVLLFIIDKIVGVEKIGGADIKLMLLTSLLFSYSEIMILTIVMFSLDFVLYGIMSIINMISGKKTVAIPMIIAIWLSVVVLFFMCRFGFYKI